MVTTPLAVDSDRISADAITALGAYATGWPESANDQRVGRRDHHCRFIGLERAGQERLGSTRDGMDDSGHRSPTGTELLVWHVAGIEVVGCESLGNGDLDGRREVRSAPEISPVGGGEPEAIGILRPERSPRSAVLTPVDGIPSVVICRSSGRTGGARGRGSRRRRCGRRRDRGRGRH